MNATDAITDEEVLTVAAKAASMAPSMHNTQPWGFALHGDELDVFADRSRGLPVVDPICRERLISCGAAIYFGRLALRGMGRNVQTSLLPSPDNPDHLARLTMDGRQPPTDAERALIRALPFRHTDRGRCDERPVPPAFIQELREGAACYSVWLRPIAAAADLISTASLLARADDIERADPAYLEELAKWRRPDSDALDGIPQVASAGNPGAQPGLSYRLREFDPSRQAASSRIQSHADAPSSAGNQLVLLLGTSDDHPRAWLQAGEALGWLLLRATVEGVAAAPMTQVLELPETRVRLGRTLGVTGHPQMLLRMGYGHAQPTTRRRAVSVAPSHGRTRYGPARCRDNRQGMSDDMRGT